MRVRLCKDRSVMRLDHRMTRAAVVAFAAVSGGAVMSARADAGEAPAGRSTSALMIPTGGDIDFGEPRVRTAPPRAPRRAASPRPRAETNDWAEAYIYRSLGGISPPTASPPSSAPASSGQPSRVVRLPRAMPSSAAPTLPVAAATPPSSPPATPPTTKAAGIVPPTPPLSPTPAGTSPITTSAMTVPPLVPPTHPPAAERDVDVIREAERHQARIDLVKLELARRTYDETRPAGAAALDQRPDWRVLERAREAFNPTEQSAADAAGFEANAYINDQDKIIVVGIAGSQDLRRDFLAADIWNALIQAQAPQHFYLAKSYIRTVRKRYEAKGYVTECVGHSLGGGACAYAAAELGIRAVVVNPISAGRLPDTAKPLITNYIVDGDIARFVYSARGNDISGDVHLIGDVRRDEARRALQFKYGFLSGPVLVVRDIKDSVRVHQIDRALDLIAAHAGAERVR